MSCPSVDHFFEKYNAAIEVNQREQVNLWIILQKK